MTQIDRRGVLKVGGAVLGATALSALAAPAASASSTGTSRRVREEGRTLDALYAEARREGGELVVYAGGDTPDQQDATKAAFTAQFPGIRLTMVVDYSKYHDVRVDNQLATRSLVPDVVQLQTLQDFTRWKQQGVLQPYKPAGFSALHPSFRDQDGAWVAVAVYAFSYMHQASLGSRGPATPRDLVDPRWRGAIASSYPNDDDAALYLYKLYAETYGWDWVRRLAAQAPQFARGTNTPIEAVASGRKVIGVAGAGSLTAPLAPGVQWVTPAGHPFMAWGQRAALLQGAPHPAAAKLYLNWMLSVPVQQTSFNGWSVRTDVRPAGNLAPIWKNPDAHLDGFPRFMADRAEVERWRQTFSLYFGEVQGAPSPGVLGLHPGR
ncbi:ABC transporter substrate-binding protein [Kineococcus sp. NPDC059986]|uniref:ABC transporter substrate-binding protein n=1 Tax=Kineococcus sp. NPDC059986 TaxID=3155538 RepID=UPI00344BAB3B